MHCAATTPCTSRPRPRSTTPISSSPRGTATSPQPPSRRTAQSSLHTGGGTERSAELLGESDDDALGAAQEAEPVDLLVLRDLADELGTVAAQAGDDVVDVLDSEHDAAYAQRVRRGERGLHS